MGTNLKIAAADIGTFDGHLDEWTPANPQFVGTMNNEYRNGKELKCAACGQTAKVRRIRAAKDPMASLGARQMAALQRRNVAFHCQDCGVELCFACVIATVGGNGIAHCPKCGAEGGPIYFTKPRIKWEWLIALLLSVLLSGTAIAGFYGVQKLILNAQIGNMEEVIRRDHMASQRMNQLTAKVFPRQNEDFEQLSRFIRDYTATVKKLDLARCPPGFAETYNRHLAAWTEMAKVFATHPHILPDGEDAYEELATPEPDGSTDVAEKKQAEYLRFAERINLGREEINKTYQELEAFVQSYGVQLPK